MAKKHEKKEHHEAKPEHHHPHAEEGIDFGNLAKIKVTPELWNAVFVLVAAIMIVGIMAGVASMITGFKTVQPTPTPVAIANQDKPIDVLLEDTIAFVESEMVTPGVTAEVTKVTTESGLYKITLTLTNGNETTEVDSYVTKDGKMLFYRWAEMTPAAAEPTATPVPQTAAFDAPDVAKPVVEFFVMSFCPYGLQAEQGLEPVYQLLKDTVDWKPHYVIYANYGGGGPDYCIANGTLCSMHGINEVNEDARQLCIYNSYDSATFWAYLKNVYTDCSLGNIETCWLTAAEAAGVDTDAVTECQEEQAVELLQAEYDLNQEMGVSGSPAVFINSMRYSGGRAPENFKQAICSGFGTVPSECSQAVGTAAATTSAGCG